MTAILRTIRSGNRLDVVMPDSAAGLYLTEQQITENAIIVVTGALTAPRPLFIPHSTLAYDIWCNTTTQGILVKGVSSETGLAIGVGVGAHVFSDGTNWRSSTGASGLGLDIASLAAKTTPVNADLLVLADSADSNALKKVAFDDLMSGAGLTLAGDVTGGIGTNSVTSIGAIPLDASFSGGSAGYVLTYDGYDLNFAAPAAPAGTLLADGSVPLTGTWDTGGENITSCVLDSIPLTLLVDDTRGFTGFSVNQLSASTGTIASGGTVTLTMHANTQCYINGVIKEPSPTTVTHFATLGLWYYYVSGTTLTASQSAANYEKMLSGDTYASCFVSFVSSTGGAVRRLADLRLPPAGSGMTRTALRRLTGDRAQLVSGGSFAISVGPGSSNSDAQFSATDNTVNFLGLERVYTNASPQTWAAIPIFYSTNTGAGDVAKKTADSYPFCYSGTPRLQYNNAGTLTDVDDGGYSTVVYFTSMDVYEPVFGVVDAGYDNYLGDTRGRLSAIRRAAEAVAARLGPGWVTLGCVVFQTSSGYGNTPKTRSVEYYDWRDSKVSLAQDLTVSKSSTGRIQLAKSSSDATTAKSLEAELYCRYLNASTTGSSAELVSVSVRGLGRSGAGVPVQIVSGSHAFEASLTPATGGTWVISVPTTSGMRIFGEASVMISDSSSGTEHIVDKINFTARAVGGTLYTGYVSFDTGNWPKRAAGSTMTGSTGLLTAVTSAANMNLVVNSANITGITLSPCSCLIRFEYAVQY